METKDSIEKLIEDIDAVMKAAYPAKAYMSRTNPCQDGTTSNAFRSISKRLHALMPHDTRGSEVKAGDEVYGYGRTYRVDTFKVVMISERGGAMLNEASWEVAVPDSWDRLEEDAGMSASLYCLRHGLQDGGGSDEARMRADLVRRAKELAEAE